LRFDLELRVLSEVHEVFRHCVGGRDRLQVGERRLHLGDVDAPEEHRRLFAGVALGDVERGNAYLRDYYAFTGPFAERVVAANLTSARAVKDFLRGYEEAGCDELVLFPTSADAAELDRLTEVVAA